MKIKRTIMKGLVLLLALVLVALVAGGIWFKTNYIKFQDGYITRNLTSVSFTELKNVDVIALDQLTALEEVDARGCREYELMEALVKRHPGVKLHYTVCLDGVEYPQDATEVTLTKLTEEAKPV